MSRVVGFGAPPIRYWRRSTQVVSERLLIGPLAKLLVTEVCDLADRQQCA